MRRCQEPRAVWLVEHVAPRVDSYATAVDRLHGEIDMLQRRPHSDWFTDVGCTAILIHEVRIRYAAFSNSVTTGP